MLNLEHRISIEIFSEEINKYFKTIIEAKHKVVFHEKSCMNCKYRLYMVALGVGIKCTNENNFVEGKHFNIPYRNYTCQYFEKRETEINKL